MSWDGHRSDWSGEALRVRATPELVALVRSTARRPGGDRSVPVHVRCSARHDSDVRFVAVIDGPAVVVELHRDGRGDTWWAYNDAAAEEVTRLHRERKDSGQPAGPEVAGVPPVQMECGACGRVGQLWAGRAVGERVLRALGAWVAGGRSAYAPRFVWPGAGV